MKKFDASSWYWIVADDESQLWSSAVSSYITDIPANVYMTVAEAEVNGIDLYGDETFIIPSRAIDEDDLTEILVRHGLTGPLVIVPDRVSPAQAEIALFRYTDEGDYLTEGALLAAVNALIDAYPYEPVRIWWRKATYISREHPYLLALAIELGLSDAVLDQLFIAAYAI